jgi:hypothetical protein
MPLKAPPLFPQEVASADSDQLGYVPGVNQGVRGKVRVGNAFQWYSFRYQDFGLRTGLGHLVIWYTDGAQRLLRWTCMTFQYVPADSRGSTTQWALMAQYFGEMVLPDALKLH